MWELLTCTQWTQPHPSVQNWSVASPIITTASPWEALTLWIHSQWLRPDYLTAGKQGWWSRENGDRSRWSLSQLSMTQRLWPLHRGLVSPSPSNHKTRNFSNRFDTKIKQVNFSQSAKKKSPPNERFVGLLNHFCINIFAIHCDLKEKGVSKTRFFFWDGTWFCFFIRLRFHLIRSIRIDVANTRNDTVLVWRGIWGPKSHLRL